MTWALIGVNAVVFYHELTLGRRLEPFIQAHALVPLHPSFQDLVTSMFLHGVWMSVPVIGASGAIAGVLGAYILFFPKAKVTTVVPIFIFLHYAEIPAFLYLGVWFLTQVYSGTMTLGADFGGVAWWAHVGGFLTGVWWAWRLGKRR